MNSLEKIRDLTEKSKEPVILSDNTESNDPKLRLPERLRALDNMLVLLDDLTAEGYLLAVRGKGDPQITKKFMITLPRFVKHRLSLKNG